MAKSRVALRGRTRVALILCAFVLVALAIVWRRTIAIGQSERLAVLDAKRVELEGERARLESDIRDASARQTLGTTVEQKLGMHIPTDKQVVILPRSRPDETP
jgi:membrane protein implicated in regulation of membrane protease activity